MRARKNLALRLGVSGVAACMLLAAGAARAAEYTWTATQAGSFDDASKWSPAGGPPGAGDSAAFNSPSQGGYVVTVPTGTRQINALRVIGELAYLQGGVLEITSAADDAVLVRNDGTSRSVLGLGGIPGEPGNYGSISVPTGGITLSGTTGVPFSENELVGGSMSADRLFVLGGTLSSGQVNIARDIHVGNAGAARGGAPVAFFTGGRFNVPASVAGGAFRIYPDGSLNGAVTAAGGVFNAGRIEHATRIIGDVVNSGEYNAFYTGAATNSLSFVEGDFEQTADGVLRLRPGDLTHFPLTLSNGTIDLAGTIAVTAPAFARLNDRLPLIGAEGPINSSATLTSGVEGYRFEPQLVAGEGLYAIVVAVPEPMGAAAILSAGVLLLRRRRVD